MIEIVKMLVGLALVALVYGYVARERRLAYRLALEHVDEEIRRGHAVVEAIAMLREESR